MHSVHTPLPLVQAVNQRDGERYEFDARVDILLDGKVVGVGELINISRSGAGFRANTFLKIGRQYSMFIAGIGEMTVTTMRKFNINCYGVKFEIGASAQCGLERRLAKLNAGK